MIQIDQIPVTEDFFCKYLAIKNTKNQYAIDYEKSEYKNEFFLNYVTNLDINCDIDIKKINVKDCSDLILAYIHFDRFIEIPSLTNAIINMLYMDSFPALELKDAALKERYSYFMKEHSKEIQLLKSVLKSIHYYILNGGDEKYKYDIVAKNFPLGKNIITLSYNSFLWKIMIKIANDNTVQLIKYEDITDMYILNYLIPWHFINKKDSPYADYIFFNELYKQGGENEN